MSIAGRKLRLAYCLALVVVELINSRAAVAGDDEGLAAHELVRKPERLADGRTQWGDKDEQEEGNKQQRLIDRFWLELEAEFFLKDLLNLTRMRLDNDGSLTSGECLKFAKSLEDAQSALEGLIEKSSLDGVTREPDLRPLLLRLAQLGLEESDHELAFRLLSKTVYCYFDCLASRMQRNSSDVGNSTWDLVPLGGYMERLAETLETSILARDFSFASLIPVNTDLVLDSLKRKHESAHSFNFPGSSLVDKLISAFKGANLRVKHLLENAKRYLSQRK